MFSDNVILKNEASSMSPNFNLNRSISSETILKQGFKCKIPNSSFNFHSIIFLLWKSTATVNCLVTDSLQNVFFCVQQLLHFWVNYPFKGFFLRISFF